MEIKKTGITFLCLLVALMGLALADHIINAEEENAEVNQSSLNIETDDESESITYLF